MNHRKKDTHKDHWDGKVAETRRTEPQRTTSTLNKEVGNKN